MLIKCKDGLFERKELGPWDAIFPAKTVEEEQPFHRWHGHKISLELWEDINAFFDWSLKETKSETIVHLFYHETEGWCSAAMPQYGYSGMAVSLVDAGRDIAVLCDGLGDGWQPNGSAHHHCEGSAFQSGTDRDDETSSPGLHITIGHVGSESLSIHARASIRGIITPVLLGDWFELPEPFQGLPDGLKDAVLRHLLTRPCTAKPPEAWMAAVTKRPVKAEPEVQSTKSDFMSLREELLETCLLYDIEPANMAAWCEKTADSPGCCDVIQTLVAHGATIEEAADALMSKNPLLIDTF